MEKAAELMQMDQDKGLTHNSTKDGFVFSIDEIKSIYDAATVAHKAYDDANIKYFRAG